MVTVVVTIASYWRTHVRGRTPGRTFLYAQALFDVALVTTIVHITGGPASDFSTLYVPLIVVTALLMPPASTALVTALVGLVYFADVIFGHQLAPGPGRTAQRKPRPTGDGVIPLIMRVERPGEKELRRKVTNPE